ncbi:High mobility group box 1 [Crenichthys baileyi]|uniref:High mobility group box 1 n=1 Tax=Crenichthys baileyi TaxID=28760 RepID=A0AAV9RK45_9TELE
MGHRNFKFSAIVLSCFGQPTPQETGLGQRVSNKISKKLAAANVRQPEPNTPDKQRNPRRQNTAESRCFSSHCFRGTTRRRVKMGKDPKKPRGKMSSYAYFVQTCREEHKKKHPEATVNFSEFSKKCSERWKTMSPKEKGKFEDMAKQDKLRYEREMKNYIPPKGQKKKRFKDPNAPKRPPSAFFLFCADFRPKVKGENPGLSIGETAKKLGEMWNSSSGEEKQPYEKKAAKLKEKYDKDIVAYRTKGRVDSGPAAAANDDEEEDEEEGDEDEEEDDDE